MNASRASSYSPCVTKMVIGAEVVQSKCCVRHQLSERLFGDAMLEFQSERSFERLLGVLWNSGVKLNVPGSKKKNQGGETGARNDGLSVCGLSGQ